MKQIQSNLQRVFKIFALQMVLTSSAMAAWVVDADNSYIGFASVKNDLIAENHSFTEVNGQIDASGQVEIIIALDSVETLIPIRNDRMRGLLFETEKYPVASIKSQVDLAEFTDLEPGESKSTYLRLEINLHGTDLAKRVLVRATRTAKDRFNVSTLGPVVVHASQFALSDGVEALRKIAGLQSIELMVPITVDLTFVK